MNLNALENKEPIIKDFFIWLFNDENINLDKERDLALVPYCKDANIYFPRPISNFFNTSAIQRLSRISQLDLAVDDFPGAYHNRLQHSKGVYYRKLEEMIHNFQSATWRNDIETRNLKLHLIAELIKAGGHDCGHFPLSHAFEQVIYSCHGPHEDYSRRIMLEDPEIHSVLVAIDPSLPQILEDLYNENSPQSSYDMDRLDYLIRDSLFAGIPVDLKNLHYEIMPIAVNDFGEPIFDNDGSLVHSDTSNTTVNVFSYSSLKSIEHFLRTREENYKKMYFSEKTHIREGCIADFFSAFLQSDSQVGCDLRNFITTLRTCDIKDVDLSLFLEWDDIKFYSEVLDIAERHPDSHIRDLAAITIPNMKSFISMMHSYLQLDTKGKNYSEEDKLFLKKIKSLINGSSPLSATLNNRSFVKDNTLVFPSDVDLPDSYKSLIQDGYIHSSDVKLKAYNPKEPIYVLGANGKIYPLSNHPDRSELDWDSKITYLHNIYAYVPFLKLNGISDEEIDDMRTFCAKARTTEDSRPSCRGYSIFMNLSKTSPSRMQQDFLDL